MPTKEERATQAVQHAGMARGLFETDNARAIESVRIYEDGEGRDLNIPEPRFESTQTNTAWEPLAETIEKARGKVCVVDPAHFTRPGGAYLNGTWSPESQICAESNLYPVLEELKKKYFDKNRQYGRGGLNSDRAAYLEDIVFTTGGVMRKRDVLVISPVNRRMAQDNHRSEAECDADMRNRIEALLRIAASREVDTLVVGAFGCGPMGNDDEFVADIFASWLDEHPGVFERVVFSIAGGPALDVFREVFPLEERRYISEPEPNETDEDPEDDFEIDVKPVSDGRWVFD